MYQHSKLKHINNRLQSRFRSLVSAFLAVLLTIAAPFSAAADSFQWNPPDDSLSEESLDYTVGEDTVPMIDGSGGNAYPFYGVQLSDADGNPLPMPRTFPAIIEGPMWNNPLGKCSYFFVTFNGKIAYCIEPFVFSTSSGVNYEQRKEFNKLSVPQKLAILYSQIWQSQRK